MVEVLEEAYRLQSEDLWIHVLAPPGQLWFTSFVIQERNRFWSVFFKVNVFACER